MRKTRIYDFSILKEIMEYLSEITSFLVGAIAGGISVKLHVNRSIKNVQSGNRVGGDFAGRDINKK